MMTRPFIIIFAASLLASTAQAERRSKRDRDRHRDEAETTSAAKRSIKGEDRRRAARSIEDEVELEEDDTPRKKKARKTKRKLAQAPGEVDSDGGEARGVFPIKLDELIEVAVRRSPQLARAKLERIAAKGDAGAARLDQAWRLNAKAQYKQYGVGGDVEVDLATVVQEEDIDGSIGLGRRLPTGGSISLDFGIARKLKEIAVTKEALNKINGDDKATGPLEEVTLSHQITGSVTLTQPLLRGLGASVALANERKADFALSEATLNAQVEAEKMVLDVNVAYWQLAAKAYELDTRLDSLELAEKHERLTREEIRAGAAPNSALNAVTYEIAQRQGAALRAQTELEKASLDVRRKVGLNLEDRSIVLRPGEPFVVGNEEFDVEDVLAMSRKSNRRLVMLAMRKRRADVDVDVAKNQMLPQLDVALSGGVVGGGETTDKAFANASGVAGYQVMASLTFSWELSGHVKDAHKAAVARRSQIEVERIDVARQLDQEVIAAVAAVKSARQRVALAEKAIAMAEDNVKAERSQFQAQRSNNFEVMKRQSELAEANLERGRAIADYHIAVAQLRFFTGTLLEEYRVNVRPVAEAK